MCAPRVLLLCAAAFCSGTLPALAETDRSADPETVFRDAYFAEVHDRDPAEAVRRYEQLLDADNAPPHVAAEASKRLAGIREELAANDLAQLMPADAVFYAELANPGSHVRQLVKLLNLESPDDGAAAGEAIPLDEGWVMPGHLAISPSLLGEFEQVRGLAVGLTEIDVTGRRPPRGLLIIHPGAAGIVRGLFETSIQFVEPVAPIAGFATHTYRQQVYITRTERLVFVASDRGDIQQAIARLQGEDLPRLADEPAFAAGRPDNKDALLHAWANGPWIASLVAGGLRGNEAAVANGVLDLQHLEAVGVTAATTRDGLVATARVELTAGHQNLLYALIRTAPLTRDSLDLVPAGVAGVATIGLNPPLDVRRGESTSERPAGDPGTRQLVSAMDIGHELFSNIREFTVFVLPSVAGRIDGEDVPDVGVVIASNDPEKSAALFDQLLRLPMIFLPELDAPADLDAGGLEGKVFRYPDAPPIALARLSDRGILLGTHGAAVAGAEAVASGATIGADASFQPLLAGLTESSSKALLIDVGRALETAALVAPRRDANELAMAGRIVGALHVALVTDEQPTAFALRAEVTNLPDVQQLIRTVMAQQHGHHSRVAAPVRDVAVATQQGALRPDEARESQAESLGVEASAGDGPSSR